MNIFGGVREKVGGYVAVDPKGRVPCQPTQRVLGIQFGEDLGGDIKLNVHSVTRC